MHPSVARHLQQHGLSFVRHRHADYSESIKTPYDFAQALGYPIERIAKSLFLSAGKDRHAIALCSINKKSKLSPIAEQLGWGRFELATAAELKRVTGYPSQGVSPLGVAVPVFIDCHLNDFETILIGAGEVGIEIELSPHDLAAATSAFVLEFAGA